MNIIPIGPNCKVAQTLQVMGLRQASYPWDWIRDTTVRDVIDVLKEEFNVSSWNKFQTMEYSMPHDYNGDSHNTYELLFEGGDLLSKYQRRFKRFFERAPTCYFLRFGDGTDLQELQELLPNCTIIHIPDGHPDSVETHRIIYEKTQCKKDPYAVVIRKIADLDNVPIHSDEVKKIDPILNDFFTESKVFDKPDLLSFVFLRIKEITGIEYPLH